MLELGLPWWEFVLRAIVVYGVLLLLVRVSGKRAVGQFTPFDMILLILLGTAVQNSLIGDDISLPGGLILAATLIGMNYLMGWVTARSPRLLALVEGRAVRLAEFGKVSAAELRRQCVSPADFEEAMRRHGIRDPADIESAWLETNGCISLIRRENK
jgi:uncharacterized membrane protein YcaP (DUF421 family)